MSNKIFLQSVFGYREDTLENWQTANPVLEKGEVSIVRDGKEGSWLKIGDGKTPWNSLDWKMGPQGDIGPKGEQGIKGDKGDKGEKGDNGKDAVIDKTYSPTSENAQSGTAVKEALEPFYRKYEFLETVNITQEGISTFTKNGYSLKDVFVKVNWNAVKTDKGWLLMKLKSNGKTFSGFVDTASTNTSGTFITNIRTLRCYNHILIMLSDTASNHGYASNFNNKMPVGFLESDKPIEEITIQYNGSFPVGATIEIWGVRA